MNADQGTRPRVLVVDDDEKIREVLSEMVTRLRYSPLVAENVSKAAWLLEKHRVSLMLLDLRMQGADGVDLLQDLRRRGIGVPTIVVSGYVSPEIVSQLMGLDVRAIVAKPFRLTRLIQEIRRLLPVPEEGRCLCGACGTQINLADRFCGECGAPLRWNTQRAPSCPVSTPDAPSWARRASAHFALARSN